jgi:hypothetical protein
MVINHQTMFKRLARVYNVKYHDEYKDMVIGIDTNSRSSDILQELALSGLTYKYRRIVLDKNLDAVQYVKENFDDLYKRERLFAITEMIDDYNLLFNLYDCDPVVYDWDAPRVTSELALPPDPVDTIMNTHWMNPWAVIHSGKLPMSREQWLRGFTPAALQAVRHYFQSEDPWVLRTVPEEDTRGIFAILFQKHYITKKGGHWIPTKPRKGHLLWKKHNSKFGLMWDIEPSFSQVAAAEGGTITTTTTFPGPPQELLDVQSTVDPGSRTTLYVGLDGWVLRRLNPDWTSIPYLDIQRAIFGKKSVTPSRIIFVTSSSQVRCQLDLPHAVYPGVTRLQVLCKFIQTCLEKRLKKTDLALNFLVSIIS